MSQNHHLTPKQLKLLEELLKGTKVVEISRKTGIPRSTIYNELRKPEFQRALDATSGLSINRTSSAQLMIQVLRG